LFVPPQDLSGLTLPGVGVEDGRQASGDYDTPIVFKFQYKDQSPDFTWTTRIAMNREAETDTRKEIKPGTLFWHHSCLTATRMVTNSVPNGNVGMAIEVLNGEVHPTQECGAERQALTRVRQLALEDMEHNGADVRHTTLSQGW
jgi:hypothetical protein